MSQDVAKKIKQSQKKKSTSVKKNLEAAAKQSAKKESPDMEVMFIKSVKKRTTRRRFNLDKRAETDDTSIKNQNVESNESIKILRDRYCDNITVDLFKNNLLQSSKDLDLEKMSNGKLQRKTSSTNTKILPIIVTPKSTPPKLNLTPHRSKKTPKKSPISLGSPKTHSIAIPKLFKSPRKLSLAATSEDSGENLEKSDSDSCKKSRKSKKHSSGSSSMSDKSLLISPTAKSKHKKSDGNLKLIVRKFSKSPKIVLKSPKSKKSKSRKLLSSSRMRKSTPKKSTSPPTTPNLNKSSKISTKKSPLSKRKSLSPIKRRLLDSKLTKTLTASQIKDVLAEPIVLLEKLSPESMKRKNMLMVASKTRSNTLIKVRSPSINARSNSKVSIKKVSVESDVSTNRNSNTKLRSSMEKSRINNTNRISPRIKPNISIQEKDRSSIPLMASTPREGKMTLMDTSLTFNTSIASVNDTSLNTRLRHRNQSNVQLSGTRDKNTNIENVSEPSLFDMEISNTSQSRFSNVTKRNATYDKDNTMEKKQKNRNNTYELEQPQTLSLRKMIKKRTSTDANLSSRNTTKKAKVHFADASGAGSAQKSINKLNGSRSSISHNVNARSSNIINSAHKLKKVETPQFSRNSLISPFKRSSPRTHGGTPIIQLNRTQVTPKTFASTEKKSGKTKPTVARRTLYLFFFILFYILISHKFTYREKIIDEKESTKFRKNT